MSEMGRDNFISAAADRLIAAHDGDVALLYIYLSRHGGEDLEQAAHDLCRTMGEIRAAWEKLSRMGLCPVCPTGAAAPTGPVAPIGPTAEKRASVLPPVPEASRGTRPPVPAQEPEPQIPEYRAEDIVRRSREDGTFAVILEEAARIIGHALSSSDMRLLFGIYDYLALPPEVILELLNYCAEDFDQRYGSGRRPSARSIEKEAYVWANREILTLEQAEEYILAQRERRSDMGKFKAAIGIQGRELTATEAKYIASWLDMGFREEAAAIAYDRTVTNTGSLKWGYMNKIMLSWHEKDLHTAGEIEAGDSRRSKAAPAAVSPKDRQINLDEMRSFLGK